MNSLTWNQITDSLARPLSIPESLETLTTLQAALEYAKHGWYVLPINAGTKHPGSLVGRDWPAKSTRDEKEIREAFRSPNVAIAIHVGRSGAVVFDVDEPAQLSDLMMRELFQTHVPFQSTRSAGDVRRGHYPFKVPNYVSYGNSLGSLGAGWGDVRGHNAIIVVAPSKHTHPEGLYQWRRTGDIPLLPKSLSDKLPKRTGGTTSALNITEARSFLAAHNNENYPEYLEFRLNYLRENLPQKNNRHTTFQGFLCLVLKDAVVGFYKASDALNEVHLLFNLIKPESEQSPNEFEGMVYWAMGIVESMTTAEKALHAYTNAPHLDSQIMEWVRNNAR